MAFCDTPGRRVGMKRALGEVPGRRVGMKKALGEVPGRRAAMTRGLGDVLGHRWAQILLVREGGDMAQEVFVIEGANRR